MVKTEQYKTLEKDIKGLWSTRDLLVEEILVEPVDGAEPGTFQWKIRAIKMEE